MHANVLPLFVFYVDLGFALKPFLFRHLRFAVRARRRILRFALNQVISRPGRYALGEFPTMVRNQFPILVLLALPTDGDPDSVQRPVVRPISGAKDQAIGFFRFLLVGPCRGLKERREHKKGKPESRAAAPAGFNSHCPRLPRPRRRLLRPHRARPPDSAPADAW